MALEVVMSKEREMIEKLCSFQMTYSDWLLLIADAEELLAQPEQEPVAWIDDGSLKSLQESTGYALRFLTNDTENLKNTDVPLYLAPPKREPLTRQQIIEGNQSMLNATREIFIKGVQFAEAMHGIGGGE